MPNKKESKRDFVAFIEACRKGSSQEYKQMIAVIENKGQDITPKELKKRFDALDYKGVTEPDCKKILGLVTSGVIDPKRWDWAY